MDIDQLVCDTITGVGPKLRAMGFPSASYFFSNPWLTLVPGDYYLIGLNPGGSEDIPSQTFDDLAKQGRERPWSAYLDESSWQYDKMQRNLAAFADQALPNGKETIRASFGTNAIFARSSDQSRIKPLADHLFRACWESHQAFLDTVRPKVIIAMGNGTPSPYSLLRTKLSRLAALGPDIPLYSTFSIKACRGQLSLPSGPLDLRIVGLPTLSRCNVASRPQALKEMKSRVWLP